MSWRASRARELLALATQGGGGAVASRLELYRRAALLADAENDADTAIAARHAIVDAHFDMNAESDLLAAFAWLLHAAPRRYKTLWAYKWGVATLAEFVAIRAEWIDGAIDDLEQRYKAAGLSTAPAAQLRLSVALSMNRTEQLPALFAAWQENESGAGSDCPACRRMRRVDYFTALQEYERAITEARPILEGRLHCCEVPRTTYPLLLLPLLRVGRIDEADDACRRGLLCLNRSEKIFDSIGLYLVYLAVRGRIDEGGRIVATWLRGSLRAPADLVRYGFFRGAALLFDASERRRVGVMHLALPPAWDGFRADGLYETHELRRWFALRAEELATRFDARNGNGACCAQLRSDRELLDAPGGKP